MGCGGASCSVKGVVEVRELMLRSIPMVPASVWHLNPSRATLPQHAWRWGLSNTVAYLLGARVDKTLQVLPR